MKKHKLSFYIILLALLIGLSTVSCTFELVNLDDPSVAGQVVNSPQEQVVLKSSHNRFVIAQNDDNWSLKQELQPDPELSGCELFTLYRLTNGKIALKTCHDRFVTAPRRGTTLWDLEVWQDAALGDCSQFKLHPSQGGDQVAFETCAGKYFTAGNDSEGWEPPLNWSVVAGADQKNDWEWFTMQ